MYFAEEVATNAKFAIKRYENTRISSHKSLQTEVSLLSCLQNPSIIRLFRTISTKNSTNLVLEFIGTTSLSEYLRNRGLSSRLPLLKSAETRFLFKKLAKAVNFLHFQGIFHRDLKLENVLVNELREIRIIDFGFAKKARFDEKLSDFCGTLPYMAPEIVDKIPYFGGPADVWALGVMLFTMVCGEFPFKGENEGDIRENIRKAELKIKANVEEGPMRIIRNTLVREPGERWTSDEVGNFFIYLFFLKI